MDIHNRKIMVLGGFGLVGRAVVRKLVQETPAEIIIGSLGEQEAREGIEQIKDEAPGVKITPVWGNIFIRDSLKDLSREEILDHPEHRAQLMADTMEPLDDDIMAHSTLHKLISRHQPHIIIDTVNSATGVAYQDIYDSYYKVSRELAATRQQAGLSDNLVSEVEKLMASLYVPQIIRHIQILYASMLENHTKVYIKVGTSGTGGMGLNIPYTHSEEKPSRVLLSKSSLAGAHTMLLFLMGRTPDAPITKEIKPAAAIAWKSIGYGPIQKRGRSIELVDCTPDEALVLGETYRFEDPGNWRSLGRPLESVYIDTGENGIFSLGEFECITTVGQMEFVTPEEIATNVIMEIKGDNTGHDIINALNNAIMGPTYRAGAMRHGALERMRRLAEEHQVDSVAFELLGPPRLSKLLHEANLLRQVCGSLQDLVKADSGQLTRDLEALVESNTEVRSKIISIGVPILMSDGKRLLRGPVVEIPPALARDEIPITPQSIDDWAEAGWVDLREANIRHWQTRAQAILAEAELIPEEESGSQYHHNREYWAPDEPLNVGKVAAWIFVNEDKGLRVKR
ncbi:MAG: short-chain dehydrogenase [Candidatus Marinimicrobia bacterium]|nr:short-chain dehydrogenase [Candidatus Neomarinimicrobiota bacterium]